MPRFFSKIRYTMINESASKYMKYAIGEIVLVVIGILIALSINNWNNDRIAHKKERAYLREIRNNLKQDSLALEEVLHFNVSKVEVVENMMQIFSDSLSNEERFRIFNENSDDFVYYRVFEPTSTAFDNMLNAESIELVSNSELKELLTQYYTYDFLGGSQDRIIHMNRKVVDRAFPKFFTREFLKERMGLETSMPEVTELDIEKDQVLISDLFGIIYLIRIQDDLMRETLEKNAVISKKITALLER